MRIASHAKLINQFYSCIENNTQDYVHVKDALPSIKMIDAIRKSSELKQALRKTYEYTRVPV